MVAPVITWFIAVLIMLPLSFLMGLVICMIPLVNRVL
jgi:hypothetical protein